MNVDAIYAHYGEDLLRSSVYYVREQPTIAELAMTEPLTWIILFVCVLGIIAQFIPKD